MALITKPDMEFIWASGGAIVEPSDVKKQTGWTSEVPPHQFENWIQNRQDEYLAHINQRGIPQWDGNTEYEAGGLSYVQGSDGKVYKSVAASGPSSVVSNPTTDGTDTYWTVAFASQGLATESVPGIVEIATAAEAQAFTANKIIDGAKLASAFMGVNVSVTASGYQKLPSGLIIQWAMVACNANMGPTSGVYFSDTPVVFPIVFPDSCRAVLATQQDSADTHMFATYQTLSTSGMQLLAHGTTAGNKNVFYVAIGF